MLPLKSSIIYGPVNSRRLGRSLGINLLPASHKLCSFDCAYCHYGRTQVKTLCPEESQFPTFEDVLRAVREGLETHPDIDYLTFSGNGEATLHPRFPGIAAGVRRLRDEQGVTIMLIEHDMQAVMGLCETITVMNFGTRLAEGTPGHVRSNPAVIEAYLGSAGDAA